MGVVGITVSAPGLGDAGEVIPDVLEVLLTRMLAFLEGEVKDRTPIGVTQVAQGSIAWEIARIGESVTGALGSPHLHVAVVNNGRRPGQKPPPWKALELWVRRRIRIEVEKKRGKGTRLLKPTVREAKGIAIAIAKKIGKDGTEGVHMFEEAVEKNLGTLEAMVAAAGLQLTVTLTKPS